MQDKGKNFKFLDSHRRLHKAFITINCQNSLIIHTYITILHLFSRKSGGDGKTCSGSRKFASHYYKSKHDQTAPIIKAKRNKSCSYGW